MFRVLTRLFAAALLVGTYAAAANATYIQLYADLSGTAESPPNASPGTGFALVELDTDAHLLHVSATFSGLVGNTTASHIHCCTSTPLQGVVGVATRTPSFVGFPLGVTSGSFNDTYDTQLSSTWNASFITANGGTPLGAEAALLAGLSSGRAYFNIHTTTVPGGEIRGFLYQAPEPGSLALLALGALGLGVCRRRRASR